MTTTHYVIRRAGWYNDAPAWVSLSTTPSSVEFTCRQNDALRFARIEDADCMLAILERIWLGEIVRGKDAKNEFFIEPMETAA